MDTNQRRNIELTLKPCPFCGAPARFEPASRGFADGRTTKVTFVRCSRCFARTGKYDIRGTKFTSTEARQLAINAWNYRFNEND